MLKELIKAFFLIFAAEMGDKTQIIAMTFATQYTIKEVLGGVALGVFFNHGIAILLGRYLSTLIPMNTLQLIAGFMFVFFGIMALRDEEEDEDDKTRKYGPLLTVALAFFIGELGDKTQLTAMSLATEGSYPIFILMGTILGMLATSSLGIFVGSRIGDRIPDLYIKIASSIVFIFFGSLKLYSELGTRYLTALNITIYLGIILIVEIILIKKLVDRRKTSKTAIQKAAERLYIHNQLLSNAIEDICLGEDSCGDCQGTGCILGYTRHILENARDNEKYYSDEEIDIENLAKKNFDRIKVARALALILKDYKDNGFIPDDRFIVNKVKNYLETILLGREIDKENLEEYLSTVKKIDRNIGEILEMEINKEDTEKNKEM